MNNNQFIHGIYFKNIFFLGKDRRQIIDRKHFYECINKGKPYEKKLQLPTPFIRTLNCKWEKWKSKLKMGMIEFTYAYNEKYAVLVITSPKDQFCKREGYKWAKRRLKKAETIYKNIQEQLNNVHVPESRKRFLKKNVKVVKLSNE